MKKMMMMQMAGRTMFMALKMYQRPLVDEVTTPVMEKVMTMQMAGRMMFAALKVYQRPLVDEVTAPVMKKVMTKTIQMAGRTMFATLKQIRITRFFLLAVKDTEVKCVAGSSKANLAVPSSPVPSLLRLFDDGWPSFSSSFSSPGLRVSMYVWMTMRTKGMMRLKINQMSTILMYAVTGKSEFTWTKRATRTSMDVRFMAITDSK